mmetsp:Transcript_44502/g.96834  ORF Transcript_44502/g.96834 Transcript_44502/m.96834 type:complete len:205 (-) Transcript_44502:538-1152(-)
MILSGNVVPSKTDQGHAARLHFLNNPRRWRTPELVWISGPQSEQIPPRVDNLWHDTTSRSRSAGNNQNVHKCIPPPALRRTRESIFDPGDYHERVTMQLQHTFTQTAHCSLGACVTAANCCSCCVQHSGRVETFHSLASKSIFHAFLRSACRKWARPFQPSCKWPVAASRLSFPRDTPRSRPAASLSRRQKNLLHYPPQRLYWG